MDIIEFHNIKLDLLNFIIKVGLILNFMIITFHDKFWPLIGI